MAVPTGSFKTFEAIGNREDLADMIYDVSPTETPFMSNVKRGKASAVLHEWQTDVLAAAANNAQLEGNDAGTNTATATSRFANRTQISTKAPRVSGTQNAVNSAGRKSEMSYQIAKRGKELKRDIETALCKKTAGVAGSAGLARQLAGIGSWLWNNEVSAAAGSTASTVVVTSGMPTTDPTDGTAATLTSTDLKTIIQYCWTDGGDPNMVLVGAHNKQLISTFAGIATQYRDNPQVGPATIIGAADVFVSDFGTVNIVPSRFTAADNLYCLDTSTWSVDYLRPIQKKDLAVTGDSSHALLLAEYTLKAESPEANGKVHTLTTS